MEFNYGAASTLGRLDDYAKVLLDCVNGDQTLFWRQDARSRPNAGAHFAILDRCDCPERSLTLHTYAAGGRTRRRKGQNSGLALIAASGQYPEHRMTRTNERTPSVSTIDVRNQSC